MTFKPYEQAMKDYEDFIGKSAAESDGDWSMTVWMAAWAACVASSQQCNMCGSMVVKQAQPDLPHVPQS